MKLFLNQNLGTKESQNALIVPICLVRMNIVKTKISMCLFLKIEYQIIKTSKGTKLFGIFIKEFFILKLPSSFSDSIYKIAHFKIDQHYK